LLKRLSGDLFISFVQPDVHQRYERDPSQLKGELSAIRGKRKKRPLVLLDEIQKVPAVLDTVQDLIDNGIANFVLTGSSARKLRRGGQVNLLPGRMVSLKLDPLTLHENVPSSLKETLLYGSLPGICLQKKTRDMDQDLNSYVTTYLEEEVRAEAIVQNLGAFGRFLELAASESGKPVNFSKLSHEIGVAHTTIMSYYQILDDCLIVERIEPLSKSRTRKKLTRAQKYLFFDTGVRRLAAREGIQPRRDVWGDLFEQFIGLELIRYTHLSRNPLSLHFWRDPDGPEVDWVLKSGKGYMPFEVKWSDTPKLRDVRHLETFSREYSGVKQAYLVCRVPRLVKMTRRVTAIPWQALPELKLS